MNSHSQPLTKEKAIKRFLLLVAGTIAFATLILFLGYGRIPVKPLLIGLAIVLPFMIISAFIGFRYREQITKNKSKLFYIYPILGIAIIIINGIIVIMGERGINYYVQIIIGFMFLFYGIKQIKKK